MWLLCEWACELGKADGAKDWGWGWGWVWNGSGAAMPEVYPTGPVTAELGESANEPPFACALGKGGGGGGNNERGNDRDCCWDAALA